MIAIKVTQEGYLVFDESVDALQAKMILEKQAVITQALDFKFWPSLPAASKAATAGRKTSRLRSPKKWRP
jgi:hypothetical protein